MDWDKMIAAMLGFEPGVPLAGYANRIAAHWDADHRLLHSATDTVDNDPDRPSFLFDMPLRRFGILVRGG